MASAADPVPPPPSITLSVRVYLDVTCPWSFVGIRRFQRVLRILETKTTDLQLDICYLPYFIKPETRLNPPSVYDARSPTTRDAVVRAKIGRLITLGREEGIAFKFSEDPDARDAAQMDPKLRPTTVPAHRLLRLAYQQGQARLQYTLLNLVQTAYFERGADVADPNVLAEIGSGVLGKDKECLVKFLNSDLLKSEVLNDEEAGRNEGVTGIPSFLFDFVVNDRSIFDFSFLGTQDTRTMEKLIDRGLQVFSRRLQAVLNEELSSSLSDQLEGLSFSSKM